MSATPTQRIRTSFRWILACAGSLSWAAGAVAVFRTSNGAGAVALVVAGALGWLVALVGRWPTKVTVSGNEFVWERVTETVDTQIEAADENGEDPKVVRELKILRQRLEGLQATGVVREHPAEAYDRQVRDAIKRVLPGSSVFAQTSRTRAQADFTVRSNSRQVLVETKWRPDEISSYRGSTLKELTRSIGRGERLLVVSNSRDVREAQNELERLVGRSGRVISWPSSDDDSALASALHELLGDASV